MIEDFGKVPERQPAKIDSSDNFRARQSQFDRPLVAQSGGLPDKTSTESTTTASVTPAVATGLPDDYSNDILPDPSATTHSAHTDQADIQPTPTTQAGAVSAKPTPKTIRLFRKWDVPKKQFIIVTAALVVLFVGGVGYALTNQSEPPKPVATVKPQAVVPTPPKPIVSPLTGAVVTAEQRDQPVMGVMIENSPDARPQSGLKDAGIVFEAIAEAGITRFLALYQESQPGNVGPIRSSRPYYIDWAMAFDASYAHVGGSPDAIQRIREIGVKDLDQFYNPSAYQRITSRFAPHNVYSGIGQLTTLAKSKGYDKSTFTSLARKADVPYKPAETPATKPSAATKPTATKAVATTPAKPTKPSIKPPADTRRPATKIDFGISSAYYNPHYEYDAASNSYLRSMGGAIHKDADSDSQLAPKTVIALVMAYGLMADGFHSQYTTIGSGKMFVFQDGTSIEGTWSKGEPKEQFVFKDAAGAEIKLNTGQTWISVVGDAGGVSFR